MQVRQIAVSRLKPWEENPRRNDMAADAVAKSIQQFGFKVPILCDQDLRIVAGHVRWKVAKKLGMSHIPVIQVELTESQRKAFSIADNKTAEIAEWDFPGLAEILKELESQEFELPSLGFSEEELQALLEPLEDFDFSQFDADLLVAEDRSHVLLQVKVPSEAKKQIIRAIRGYATEHGIVETDSILASGHRGGTRRCRVSGECGSGGFSETAAKSRC